MYTLHVVRRLEQREVGHTRGAERPGEQRCPGAFLAVSLRSEETRMGGRGGARVSFV